MPKKIFFDARFIKTTGSDGISRYSHELLCEFAKLTDVTAIIYTDEQHELLPTSVKTVLLNNPQSLSEIFIARKLNKLGADIVFSPMQIMGSLGKQYKLILSLHDTIYYQFKTAPNNISKYMQFFWKLFHISKLPQRLTLNRADAVVTVSKSSKLEIEKMKLTKKPIVVIPNAANDVFSSKINVQADNKLLYMGSFFSYKNVEFLVKAMNQLPDYELHLLSKVTSAVKRKLRESMGLQSTVVFHDGTSEKEYMDLLMTSFAMVSASKAEGFGLSLIEAMKSGLPVVCSDLAIFHEVTNDEALFFDTHSIDDFQHKIRMLEDKKTRNNLIASGVLAADKYSWAKSAKKLLRYIDTM